MGDCIFCDIVQGRAAATFLYRDDLVSAFLDIRPVATGHLLVVPNRHATYLADLDPEAGARIFQVAQRLAQALRESGLRCEGVNLFLADGVAASQEVMHVHLHVFPRWRGDGFGLRFPSGYGARPARAELDAVGASIRSALRPTKPGLEQSGGD